MDLNFNFNQKSFLNKLSNSSILIYGPANTDIQKDVDDGLFEKYDYIIFNCGMHNILRKYKDINKLKIINVLSGAYVEYAKDDIINQDNEIYFYLVSEIHTFNAMLNYGINPEKMMHMANNFKNYGLDGWPQLGPKLFVFLDFYGIAFKKLHITGYTFYMDLDKEKCIYNLDYMDYDDLIKSHYDKLDDNLKNKKKSELTDEEKILLIRMDNNLSLEKNHNINTGHSIWQGWNLFLRFFSKNIDKIKLDKKLKKIVKKYPKLLDKDPL